MSDQTSKVDKTQNTSKMPRLVAGAFFCLKVHLIKGFYLVIVKTDLVRGVSRYARTDLGYGLRGSKCPLKFTTNSVLLEADLRLEQE